MDVMKQVKKLNPCASAKSNASRRSSRVNSKYSRSSVITHKGKQGKPNHFAQVRACLNQMFDPSRQLEIAGKKVRVSWTLEHSNPGKTVEMVTQLATNAYGVTKYVYYDGKTVHREGKLVVTPRGYAVNVVVDNRKHSRGIIEIRLRIVYVPGVYRPEELAQGGSRAVLELVPKAIKFGNKDSEANKAGVPIRSIVGYRTTAFCRSLRAAA
jgi:hypothetical protein